ncbi:MAG: M24 family metallopeptidase [bacterium]
MRYKKRNTTLQSSLSDMDIDGILVTCPENITYLTGMEGVEGIYCTYSGGGVLFTDFRYINAVKEKDCSIETMECRELIKDIAQWLAQHGLRRIGFESRNITVDTHRQLTDALSSVTLVPCADCVEQLRLIKDKDEQELIRTSARILGEVMDQVPGIIGNTSGITERDLAVEMDYMMKKAGAQRSAFEIIIATDERSAFPHSSPTNRAIGQARSILVDCGAVFQGYHSDMTRVMAMKPPREEKMRDVYEVVREAQRAAMDKVSPGACARDIDGAARKVISDAGFEAYFGHGTGHGVGLMIHEEPRISAKSDTIVREGMIFTIEPGIYLEHAFGIRWEDMVVVTEGGCESLTAIKWDSLEVL